jgi:hypothetical protein
MPRSNSVMLTLCSLVPVTSRSDVVKGSPKNLWTAEFSEQIRRNKVNDMLTPSFSTTTPVEKAAAQVVLMDSFKAYFNYQVMYVCGIPVITLEGRLGRGR